MIGLNVVIKKIKSNFELSHRIRTGLIEGRSVAHVIFTKIHVTSLTSSSSRGRRAGSSLSPSSKPSHPSPGSSTWGSPPASSVPILTAVFVAFGVGVRIDQSSEEKLEEGDDAPEEVRDGVQPKGLGLQDLAIRRNINHD